MTNVDALRAAVAAVRDLPETKDALRDVVRAVPRGPWTISGQIGVDRTGFDFAEYRSVDTTVDFTRGRESLEAFLSDVGRHALVLHARTRPLVDALNEGLPAALAGTDDSAGGVDQALAGAASHAAAAATSLGKYQGQLETYRARITAVRGDLEPSIESAVTTLAATTLAGDSGGAVQLRDQVALFARLLREGVDTIDQTLCDKVPSILTGLVDATDTIRASLPSSTPNGSAAVTDVTDLTEVAQRWREALAV